MQVISDQSKVRKKLKPQDLMVVKVDDQGKKYLEISLTMGKKAIADYEDYESLSRYKWHAIKCQSDIFYAGTQITVGIKKQKCMPMHKFISGFERTDHIDGNGLNNRRSNLRACTQAQNCANRRKITKETSSKYKGVCWHKRDRKWRCSFKKDGKTINVGSFKSEVEAARAYDKEAIKHFGTFAKLNFELEREIKKCEEQDQQ